jgi:hypothetical protein
MSPLPRRLVRYALSIGASREAIFALTRSHTDEGILCRGVGGVDSPDEVPETALAVANRWRHLYAMIERRESRADVAWVLP